MILSVSLKELQQLVSRWMHACFSENIIYDKVERNYRFLEEALELVQSLGLTKNEAHALVDYVYGRPTGKAYQETGGVLITLAALGNANAIQLGEAAETELRRVWDKIDAIREKHATKKRYSSSP